MPNNFQIILCTCPEAASAKLIAKHLVNKHLAACVNILPAITSIYRWQESIEESQEHLLIIKTLASLYAKVEQAIRQHHPYQTPGIIALTIEQGSSDYFAWLTNCLKEKTV